MTFMFRKTVRYQATEQCEELIGKYFNIYSQNFCIYYIDITFVGDRCNAAVDNVKCLKYEKLCQDLKYC